MGALPATSRHTRHLPWLLPSGPDLVNRVALRENQQAPIESVENQRAGALSLLPRLIATHRTTYGDVAKLAGSPRAARQVGGVLKRLPEGSTLPWHRVVNRHGTISLTGPDLQRQRQALLAEGVMVSGSGQIDLQRYRWNY